MQLDDAWHLRTLEGLHDAELGPEVLVRLTPSRRVGPTPVCAKAELDDFDGPSGVFDALTATVAPGRPMAKISGLVDDAPGARAELLDQLKAQR